MTSNDSTAYIYVATNIITGKQYVGQTKGSVQRRWNGHLAQVRGGTRACRVFHMAIKKYGASAFRLAAIELPIGLPQVDIDAIETETIRKLNTLAPRGYNLRCGGKGALAHPETRARQSAALKGRVFTDGWRQKLSEAARRRGAPTLSAESRARISASLRSHFADADVRKRHGAAHVGMKRSPEARAKMSVAAKGRVPWSKGCSLSDSHRAALSSSLTGRKHGPLSDEHRAKLSSVKREWHARRRASERAA